MMRMKAGSGRSDPVAPRSLSELMQCPPSVCCLLNQSSRTIHYEAGDIVFHQFDDCRGLYLIISGEFRRRTNRLKTQLMLGYARSGDLVELGAALGGPRHSYTLSAASAGSVLMLPIEALHRAFDAHPPLCRQLLEEMAREVSRSYEACRKVRLLAQKSHAPRAALVAFLENEKRAMVPASIAQPLGATYCGIDAEKTAPASKQC